MMEGERRAKKAAGVRYMREEQGQVSRAGLAVLTIGNVLVRGAFSADSRRVVV